MKLLKYSLPVWIAGFLAVSMWVGRSFKIIGISLQLAEVTALALAVVYFLQKSLKRNSVILNLEHPLFIRYLFLFASMIFILISGMLSSLNAINIGNTIKFEIKFIVAFFVLISLAGVLRRDHEVKLVSQAIIVGALISSTLAILGQFVPDLGIYTIGSGARSQGLLLNPNQFGMMLAATAPLAISSLVVDYRRIYGWISVLMVVIGLVLSGSKANLIIAGTVSAATLLLITSSQSSLKIRLYSLFKAALVAVVVGLVALSLISKYTPNTLTKIQLIIENPQDSNAVKSRLYIWNQAISVVKEKPYIGIGAENAGFYLGIGHAHNVFMDYYLTMGVIGLTALTAFLLSLFAVCWFAIRIGIQNKTLPLEQRARVIALGCGILSYVASNQTSESFGGTTIYLLWIYVGLLIAHTNLLFKRINSTVNEPDLLINS